MAEGNRRRSPRHSQARAVSPTVLDSAEEQILWDEIEADRVSERWLVAKGLLAIGIVVALVVIREVFFQ